tara:strand:+ start:2231 stop:2668 length:438 start_codon:yes stop_codon:yes gene_type:complete
MNNFKGAISTKISVQWGEMDAFNHVNNVVYIRWCETARIELFRNIWGDKGINMKEILEGSGVGPILANFNINYKIPISYPDNVIIQTRVAHIGNSSFNVEHQVFTEKMSNSVVAEASSVVVMLNYKTGEKFTLDSSMKLKLEQFC